MGPFLALFSIHLHIKLKKKKTSKLFKMTKKKTKIEIQCRLLVKLKFVYALLMYCKYFVIEYGTNSINLFIS